jgi:hypothetical protein
MYGVEARPFELAATGADWTAPLAMLIPVTPAASVSATRAARHHPKRINFVLLNFRRNCDRQASCPARAL